MESLRINKIRNYYFNVIFLFSIFETFYGLKLADAFPTISNLIEIPSIKNENFCRTFSFSNSSVQCSLSDLSNKFFLEEFSNFLNQLSPDEARSFVYLFKDSNLTKAESKIAIVKQAFGLPENLRNIFIQTAETSVKNMKLIESEFDKISEEKLNPETQAIYFQIKNIYKNDNLTILQECQQLNTIIFATPTKIIKDLENAYGKLSTCNENFPQLLPSPPPISPEIPAIATVNNIIPPQIYPQWNINNNNPQRYQQQQDFNQGLLIPIENKLPINNNNNNFDLNQIFGGGGNNNNIFGPMPLIPLNPIGGGFDLIGTFTEVASLAKNLNNLLNGLQNLYNSNFNNNGYYKIINGGANNGIGGGGIQNGGFLNNFGNPSSMASMSPYYQQGYRNGMNYNPIPQITNFNWNSQQPRQPQNTNSYLPQQTFYYYPPMQQ